jgi:hypothetical protein
MTKEQIDKIINRRKRKMILIIVLFNVIFIAWPYLRGFESVEGDRLGVPFAIFNVFLVIVGMINFIREVLIDIHVVKQDEQSD